MNSRDHYILYKHNGMFFMALAGRESNDRYSYILRDYDPGFPVYHHNKIDAVNVIMSTHDRELAMKLRVEVSKLYNVYSIKMHNLSMEYFDDIVELIGDTVPLKNIMDCIDLNEVEKIITAESMQYRRTDNTILFYGLDPISAVNLYNYFFDNSELNVEIEVEGETFKVKVIRKGF